MRTIKSLNIGSLVLYGAVLAAFWTLAFGIYYWIMGWIFGAQWCNQRYGTKMTNYAESVEWRRTLPWPPDDEP